MATAYINETIEVPNVNVQNINYEQIGDGDYTALGTYREDNITVKRVWNIEAEYLTNAEYTTILNHLLSVNFGGTKFWLDEFGGDATTDSIDANIKLTNDERVQFSRDGTFHNDGRNITLEIIER